MQQQRAWTLAQQNRPGVRPIGVFLAVVMGTDARLTNIMPLGYDPADLPDPPDLKDGDDWTKWLWKKMNVDVLVERMNQMVGMPVSKMCVHSHSLRDADLMFLLVQDERPG
jgi:hypothetical protein